MRPKKLASDEALAIPTIQHAVKSYEDVLSCVFDYIVMLQPTAPLRNTDDIDNSLNELISKNADSIISVTNVGNNHPYKMKLKVF